MGCINLTTKSRKGKKFLYCKLLNKEIKFDNCRNCINKEYKEIKFTKVNKKFTKIKFKKNSKITKLERNRKSVFTDNLDVCIICGKPKEELHEIFCGRNRLNSMRYAFVLPLCHECHQLNQNNPFFNEFWHKKGQEYFECNLGSREQFIEIFGRNYL